MEVNKIIRAKEQKQPENQKKGGLKEEAGEQTTEMSLKIKNYTRYFLIAATLAIITSSGLAYYFYNQYSSLKQNPNKQGQEETDKLIAQVGALIVLPEAEVPTIATVTDSEKLRGQPFFINARTGDKVLIYANSKKAILYRPSENKIVEIAPINVGGEQE